MKSMSKYPMQMALGACLAVSLSSPLFAEDAELPDTSAWVCKFCVATYGWSGDIDVGAVGASNWSPKFGDYRGFDDDGVYLDLGGYGGYLNENGYYMDVAARNLGLDSRAVDARGGKQGAFEWRLDYSEIPRYMGYDTVTPYSGVGSDRLTLPDGWKMSTSDPSDFVPLPIDLERKTLGLGLSFGLGSAWDFDVDYERQDKEGLKAFSGGTFISNASTFPAPVDYQTDRMTAGIGFNSRFGQLRLEFTASDFDNGYSSLTWDSPLPIGWGDEIAQSALAPDNKYHMFSLSGAFRLTNHLRITAKVSSGVAEQNDPFLAYSINPAFADRALPRESLDGELETSMFNVFGRIYWSVNDWFNISATYKTSERDNNTPVDYYLPVLQEIFARPARTNRPYGYERDHGAIEFRFRALGHLRVNAGVRRDTIERTYQAVEKSDEDTIWGEIQFAPWAWLDARFKMDESTRTPSDYVPVGGYERAENPLMRKFNLAERDRERITAELDLMPTEDFNLSISYYTTDDSYKTSVLGLQESEESSLNLDASYALGAETSLYAFYSDETIDATMAGAESFAAAPWMAVTKDSIETWGMGLSGRLSDRLTYGIDYVKSEASGDIRTDSGAGEAPFPTLTTELRNLRAYVDFQVTERWALGLDAYSEEYDSQDWYVDGIGPTDINGILGLGAVSPDYTVNVIRLLARFKL
jgi:MtrB/PioB family decaheme-associated outer membrane protein